MNLNNTSPGTPQKILIIRLSSIGDIILSTPFIRQVRIRFPNAQIDFVIKDIYKDLVKCNPYINNLYNLQLNKNKSELTTLRKKIEKESYDIVFDLHNNLRSNYLKRNIGAGSIHSIHKGKLKQSLLVWFKINTYDRAIQIPERYFKVAREFGIKDDGEGLELYWDNEIKTSAKEKSNSFGINLNEPIFGLAPGAGFYTKRWPLKKFENLIDLVRQQYKMQVVVFGGEEDIAIGSELKKNKNVINLCGELSLLETAYLISKGKVLVSNDTGLMHMATAVKTPVLAIFGSTVRELGFFPYRSVSNVVENINLTCRPCSHIGRNECPKDHFRCMEDISSEQVYKELVKFL